MVKKTISRKKPLKSLKSQKNQLITDQNELTKFIRGRKLLSNFIENSPKEMQFIKLPFHINLIRKRNSNNYTKYTKIYRKRMLKLIGHGNRFGPHYHKDINGKIHSMEYTDRITAKSLIFFRCQLKGCKAKGVLHSDSKEFEVIQDHALSFEMHTPNKKSSNKILIEKKFKEEKCLKDIQIIFCKYLVEDKKKIGKNSVEKKDFNYQNFKNEKNIEESNLTPGEIFKNYYDKKYLEGENKYSEYINKIISSNNERKRKIKEIFIATSLNNDYNFKEIDDIDFIVNCKGKSIGDRYHKNLNGEIYLYEFNQYIKEKNKIEIFCKYKKCTGRACYDIEEKKFKIIVPHLYDYKSHFDNLYKDNIKYSKVINIFKINEDVTDIQEIYI